MDLFTGPEGLRDFEYGQWPAVHSGRVDCGCYVEQGEPVGRWHDDLVCGSCLEQEWGAASRYDYGDGHGGPF